MSAFSRRDRRALWIGALIVGPVLAWRGLAAPYVSWLDAQDARAAAAAELFAREQALVRDRVRLPSMLDEARRHLDAAAPSLFRGSDTVAVTASLAGWCRDAARAVGLADVRVEPATADPELGRLIASHVDVYARGSMPALAAWLARIERGDRAVSVPRLDISVDDEGLLTVHAHVRGLGAEGIP
jgi:hypothetical protein